MLRLFVLLFVALLVAFAVGTFVNGEPGYIMVRYQGRVVETSFVLFAAALAVAFFALWIVIRSVWWVATAWPRFKRRRERRRRELAERTLRDGLMALAEGDWRRAENLLTRDKVADDVPVIRYLGAAQAASAMADNARRDSYLKLAHKALPDADAAVWLKQAEMHLKDGHWEEARSTIDHLRVKFPDNREACRLARELYELTDDWHGMKALLPDLRHLKIVDRDELEALERRVAAHTLATADSFETLQSEWNQLSAPARKDDAVFTAYARGLVNVRKEDEAEPLVRKRLKQSYSAPLAVLYARLDVPASKRLDLLEGFVDAHPEDAVLLAECGDLARENDEPAKARDFFARSVDAVPDAATFAKLAAVLESLGDGDAAMDAYRAGLSLAVK